MELEFKRLEGKILKSIENIGDCELILTTDNGETYKLYHEQNCCESVSIDEIHGDLNDLLGEPILLAEESSNSDDPAKDDESWDESWTWTFYKLSTIKGSVTIKWYGSSNGYYSEYVDFIQINDKGEKDE